MENLWNHQGADPSAQHPLASLVLRTHNHLQCLAQEKLESKEGLSKMVIWYAEMQQQNKKSNRNNIEQSRAIPRM